MDDCDRASEAAEEHLQHLLAKAKSGSVRSAKSPGPEICVDCKKKIQEKRRKVQPGCERCVGCQEEYEDYLKWRGNK